MLRREEVLARRRVERLVRRVPRNDESAVRDTPPGKWLQRWKDEKLIPNDSRDPDRRAIPDVRGAESQIERLAQAGPDPIVIVELSGIGGLRQTEHLQERGVAA